MVGGGSAEQVERQLEDWAKQAEQKAERYQQMGAAVSSVSATESTSDGMVRVTVNSSGAISSLELTDRIRESSGVEVAAQVMACMQKAQSRLAGQVAAAMEATIGDDPSTINTVVAGYEQRFPQPVQDEPADDGHIRIGDLPDDDESPGRPEPRPQPRRPSDDDDWDGGSVLH